ncbi:MAG: adenine deaminase [Candidatus Cloacimonetes bacterium]|nr:adenine deaminase [Candidatus Cloacimonadota bacterium]
MSTDGSFVIAGQVVDVIAGTTQPSEVSVREGRVVAVRPVRHAPNRWIMPGFIDAHVHIESSMLTPVEFARMAAPFGTVATVSDPHEIANVLGLPGIDFMLANAAMSPLKFHFGASSCVPASPFETSGATLDVAAVRNLLRRPDIHFLSEVMNWPGVIAGDAAVIGKIEAARALGKPVDGHAPGLRGSELAVYVRAGIATDHETFELDEGREKIALGMKLILRQGSGARNLDALLPLLDEFPNRCMLCTDDIHPDLLESGHIDRLVRRAIRGGVSHMKVLRAATLNPALHYGLDVGLLQPGDSADFIVTTNPNDLRVLETWIAGVKVANASGALFPSVQMKPLNAFRTQAVSLADIALAGHHGRVHVIDVVDGQVFTGRSTHTLPLTSGGALAPDPDDDVIKLVVVNRYRPQRPAIAFVRGFGLREGALASSVAHDSHNIIACGCNDSDLVEAINAVIRHKGGLAFAQGSRRAVLKLPVAGLMSDRPGQAVAKDYRELTRLAVGTGSSLSAPYMALSFLALTVIPRLKLSDLGLVDTEAQAFISVAIDDPAAQ